MFLIPVKKRLSTVDAAKRAGVTTKTVLCWIKRGVRGVTLEADPVGGKWYTSRKALARFMRRLRPNPGPVLESIREVRKQRRQQKRVNDELQRRLG